MMTLATRASLVSGSGCRDSAQKGTSSRPLLARRRRYGDYFPVNVPAAPNYATKCFSENLALVTAPVETTAANRLRFGDGSCVTASNAIKSATTAAKERCSGNDSSVTIEEARRMVNIRRTGDGSLKKSPAEIVVGKVPVKGWFFRKGCSSNRDGEHKPSR